MIPPQDTDGTSAGECLTAANPFPMPEPYTGPPAPEPSVVEIAEVMQNQGGGFVRALAVCVLRADPENLARIKAAWPEYWAQYAGYASMKKNTPTNA